MTELLKEAFEYYRLNPYNFVVDMIGATPTPQQKLMLDVIPKAMKERKGIAVRSGHGVGKTACESWVIIWFMTCYPNSRVPCTAPTQPQLYDILWSELSKWHNKSKIKQMFEWTQTHFKNKAFPETWFAVARSSNKPENMQGFHGDHLLFIIDEAPGVEDNIMEVVEGALTKEGALCIMLGNPTQISGFFHSAFHKHRDLFYTFNFSSIDCARDRPDIVDPSYATNMAKKYGVDSDIYKVRVLGDFPSASPDTIISLDKVEKAVNREDLIPSNAGVMVVGCDVARYGNCETTIYLRRDKVVEEYKTFNHRDTMATAGELAFLARKYQGKYDVIFCIDDTGVGGGVVDRLQEVVREEKLSAVVIGVNNGASSYDEGYVNLGTEQWFWLREHIHEYKLPNDETVIAQLSCRKYGMSSKGKLQIERKEDLQKRGLESPDRADAVLLTFFPLISNFDEGGYSPCIA